MKRTLMVMLLMLSMVALACEHPDKNSKTDNDTPETVKTVKTVKTTNNQKKNDKANVSEVAVIQSPEDVPRMSPADVHKRIQAHNAHLVAAYDSDEKFKKFALEGAISRSELNTRLPALSKDHELIFYCA